MNKFLRNTAWWIGILLLQMVLIFYFSPTMVYTPYIYLLLLFRASNSLSRISLLILAFFTGLLIDTFTNSWGVHTFSAVFTAFSLPLFVSTFSQQSLSEEAKLSPRAMGSLRYGVAILLLFFIYHFIVLLLWNFSFQLVFHQLLKALISSVIACLLVALLYNIFKPQKEEDNG